MAERKTWNMGSICSDLSMLEYDDEVSSLNAEYGQTKMEYVYFTNSPATCWTPFYEANRHPRQSTPLHSRILAFVTNHRIILIPRLQYDTY